MRPVLAITCVVLLAASFTSGSSSPVARSLTPLGTPSLQPVADTESVVEAVESAGYKVKE
jgi:hypothetical protein